jgi:predicted dehydrogenase
MAISRRDFLKKGAFGAISVAMLGNGVSDLFGQKSSSPLRFGIIGVGSRGTGLLTVLLNIPNTTVTAICDMNKANLDNAIKIVEKMKGTTPAGYSKDEYDYRNMLKRDDVDAVLIATSIKWHAIMSSDALKANKHVGCEVPGGYTEEELTRLIKARETSGRHYMLLENYNYFRANMAVYNMTQKGVFGETYFAECAYLHETDFLNFNPDGSLTWRGELRKNTHGNWYATHEIGPVSKWLGINEGDRFKYLVCMQTEPRMAHIHAVQKFGAQSEQAKIKFKTGEMITTLIYTEMGKVIRVDFGPFSPHPQSVYYSVQGTKGGYDSRAGVYIEGVSPNEKWEDAEKYLVKYENSYWQQEKAKAEEAGHGGSDYFVMRDFVEMVRQDREPWIDVYDSAAWSIIYKCTQTSLEHKSAPVDIPDFTGGRWKDASWRKDNMKPL